MPILQEQKSVTQQSRKKCIVRGDRKFPSGRERGLRQMTVFYFWSTAMSDNIQLNAEPRADSGKGASRRLRRINMVPAVVYGGDSDPQSVSLDHDKFNHELENEAIYTQLIDLNIGKDTDEVILRDLQRHPFKNRILHADFFRIDKKKPIKIVVPIHVLNAENCVGVRLDGGMMTQLVTEIEIIALPKNLPEYLEVDAENLHLRESLT